MLCMAEINTSWKPCELQDLATCFIIKAFDLSPISTLIYHHGKRSIFNVKQAYAWATNEAITNETISLMSRTPGLLLNRQMGNDNAPCFAEEVPLPLLLSHFNKIQSTKVDLGNCPPETVIQKDSHFFLEKYIRQLLYWVINKRFSDTTFVFAMHSNWNRCPTTMAAERVIKPLLHTWAHRLLWLSSLAEKTLCHCQNSNYPPSHNSANEFLLIKSGACFIYFNIGICIKILLSNNCYGLMKTCGLICDYRKHGWQNTATILSNLEPESVQ